MIDTSDVERFAARLDTSPGLTEEVWKREWSERVADDWRANAAVDSGEYRDSIRVTADGASSDVEHSVFLEYGTEHMPPQPALLPAINSNIRRAADDAGDRIIRDLT